MKIIVMMVLSIFSQFTFQAKAQEKPADQVRFREVCAGMKGIYHENYPVFARVEENVTKVQGPMCSFYSGAVGWSPNIASQRRQVTESDARAVPLETITRLSEACHGKIYLSATSNNYDLRAQYLWNGYVGYHMSITCSN